MGSRAADPRDDPATGRSDGFGNKKAPLDHSARRLLDFAAQGRTHDERLWMPIAEATGAVGDTSCRVGTAEQVAAALQGHSGTKGYFPCRFNSCHPRAFFSTTQSSTKKHEHKSMAPLLVIRGPISLANRQLAKKIEIGINAEIALGLLSIDDDAQPKSIILVSQEGEAEFLALGHLATSSFSLTIIPNGIVTSPSQ